MFWGKYGYYGPWGLKIAYRQDTMLLLFCSDVEGQTAILGKQLGFENEMYEGLGVQKENENFLGLVCYFYVVIVRKII